VDTIKIPAPFVQLADDSGLAHTQVPIIRSIVSLATELDLTVVAEGVETLEEIERLQELNCQFAQGFAFGAAMSGTELGKKLAAQFAR
jgi:EAL domain-containing protein (putative c-di-GMP-specific phosphodiesterase class I)